MTRPSRDILIGLTAIGGLLVLAWMLMRFGELAAVGAEYNTVTLRSDSARGISPVAPVTYRGVRVGDVTGIRLVGDGSTDTLIDVRYGSDFALPDSFDVYLEASFVGDAVLDIEPRPSWAGGLAAGEGETYEVVVRSLTSTLQTDVLDRLDSLETLAETYNDLGETIADFVDSDTEGKADLRDSLDRFVTAADSVVRETQIIRLRSEETLDKADQALSTLDSAGVELNAIAARINRGEGTIGQLVTNPDLYNSLSAAIEQLNALITDLRLLVEKYRDEGVNIDVF